MKIEIEVFPVNLQEGFLMGGMYIVAAYSHHRKTIYVKVPNNIEDYKMPGNFKDYKIINGFTDSFGIDMWINEGTKKIKDLTH